MSLGCFGSAICFDLQEEQCSSCKDNRNCFIACQDSTAEMNKDIKTAQNIQTRHLRWGRKLDVKVIGSENLTLNLHLSEEEKAFIKPLSLNAEKLAKSIIARGYDLKKLVQQKQNPFKEEKPVYLHCAWALVVEKSIFNTADIVETLRTNFPQWTQGTLYSHVAIVTNVFQHLGVIRSLGGKTYENTYV